VRHEEDAEPVAAPHCRERPLRRPLVAGEPEAKAVIVGDPVQAVVRVRLAPAASRRGFEQYLRTLAYVRCGWQVTGDVDYELLIACRAIADLDSVLTCLRGCGGTEMASAELVLHEVAGPEAARPAPALAGATARPGRPVRPRPACVSTETWTRESGR
jgi:DNA-binding Lrp family transcriptional regulator